LNCDAEANVVLDGHPPLFPDNPILCSMGFAVRIWPFTDIVLRVPFILIFLPTLFLLFLKNFKGNFFIQTKKPEKGKIFFLMATRTKIWDR
jgi:hypothetical protein